LLLVSRESGRRPRTLTSRRELAAARKTPAIGIPHRWDNISPEE